VLPGGYWWSSVLEMLSGDLALISLPPEGHSALAAVEDAVAPLLKERLGGPSAD